MADKQSRGDEVDGGQMSLIEHLTELRSRLIKMVLAVAVGAVVVWIFYNPILEFLKKPLEEADPLAKLILTDPLQGLTTRLKVSAYGGIALATPVLLWQLWRFITPGLYPKERRYAVPFVISGVVLFLLGAGLAYWTLPRALEFLIDIGGGGADLDAFFTPDKYIQLITYMMLAFGAGFEFPIVLVFLQLAGIISYQRLASWRRYAIIGIVVLVAVITPSGDPISLTVLSVPMYLFYEISILIGRLITRRRARARDVTRTFTLDPFQQQAVAAIDRGESVLVAAPTGAGKTVVAEHAVDRVLEDSTGRVFYTTPIKALSNQKYGDLVRRHGAEQIGLLTGDNSINGDARVVVMTTEVLRNMIYAGRPLDDLRFVVLDEVHYLQDTYRGPVWEEVIIHVPAHVRLVCLSATVSNADELAAWLTEVRGPTATIIEHHRPVELEHLYAVADGVEDRLRIIPTLVADRPNPEGPEFDSQRIRGRTAGRRPRHRWFTPERADLVDHLEQEGLLPAIFFVFSRAGCDEAARQVARIRPALTDAEERARIDEIVEEHVAELSDRDLVALQFGLWREGLQAGVAAHHAGMVPPFKEAVEACFVEGLVKVVFATETLALGINMPARSVVISSLSKFTGERHERLTPSQYTQLTGRAGRRGIDDHGTAIVAWSPFVAFADVATLAASRRFELRSAFRPTYNMAANLVRRHDPETAHRLLALSFAQFQSDRALVRAERGIEGRRRELAEADAAAVCELGSVEEYLAFLDAGKAHRARSPQRDIEERLGQLSPGDVVEAPLRDGHERVAVLSVAHRAQGQIRVRAVNRSGRVLTFGAQTVTGPPTVLGALELPEPYRPNNQKFRNEVARRLERTRTRRPNESSRPATDPDEHPVAGCPDLHRHLRSARRARRLRQEIAAHQRRLGQDSGSLAREFDRVLQVLDGHGFLDGWALTDAGLRLARIYHECDLLVAEAVDEGLFDGLDGPDLVALLSCFTYEHRSPEPAPAPSFPNVALRGRWERLADLATGLLKEEAALSLRLTREPDPGFIPLAHEWTRGDALDEVLGDDDLSGGDFVRQIRQLLDLLRQIAEVAPDPTTRETARSAIRRVDRGVVAASSAVSVP